MRARGFTIIEALIGTALGLVIVGTAFAAFRVASQSVTAANRLSIENALLRAGFLGADEEVDHWTSYDDPEDERRQGLRGGTAGNGLPFTPFTDSYPRVADTDAERAVGWDPSESRWAMHEPGGWYRGNMAERGSATDLRFGRYAIFASTDDQVALGADGAIGMPEYGTVRPPRAWQYRQQRGLMNALGYYGLMEYAPANWMFHWYEQPGPDRSRGGVPNLVGNPGTGFNNGDGWQWGPRGKYRGTYMTSYLLSDPQRRGAGVGDLLWDHRVYYDTGYNADPFATHAQSMHGLGERTDVPDALLALAPPHWPAVTVSVARFYKNTRSIAMCRVRLASPLTGERIELSFASFGTSLRGARQQRRHPDDGGGWARWDNGGGAVDRTLDSY